MPGRSKLVLPAVAVVALGALAGCSGGSSDGASSKATAESVADKPCSLVSEATVESIINHGVSASSTDGLPCTYAAGNPQASSVVIELRTKARADDPERLLPNGTPVKGVGDAARFDPAGGALGPRLVARKGGTLVIVDLGPVPFGDTKAEGQTADLAEAALQNAPASKVTPAEATDEDGPCAQLGDGEALGKAVDRGVVVTPNYPVGCSISVVKLGNATLASTELAGNGGKVIAETNRSTNDKPWPRVEVDGLGDAAVWLSDPASPGAGQLLVAVGDQLVTVSTDASAGTPEGGQRLATAIARAALN